MWVQLRGMSSFGRELMHDRHEQQTLGREPVRLAAVRIAVSSATSLRRPVSLPRPERNRQMLCTLEPHLC